jgi:predicted transcriptional regulator
MIYAIAGFLTFLSVLFIAYPLVARSRSLYDLDNLVELGDTKQRRYLESKKRTVLDNIKDLDFEHDMGKLSAEDYERLRAGYLSEAQKIVEELDKLAVREEIDELIEAEVRERRRVE